MKSNKILLIVQLCISLLFGISIIKQEEYSARLIQINNSSIMKEYSSSVIKEYETKNIFKTVYRQINDTNEEEQELLAKSKREKIFVTGD